MNVLCTKLYKPVSPKPVRRMKIPPLYAILRQKQAGEPVLNFCTQSTVRRQNRLTSFFINYLVVSLLLLEHIDEIIKLILRNYRFFFLLFLCRCCSRCRCGCLCGTHGHKPSGRARWHDPSDIWQSPAGCRRSACHPGSGS